MVVSSLLNCTWPSWKTAVKLLSQNWHIKSRALFWSAGKTWAQRAARSNCGKGHSAVWVDCIVSPLGSLTEMPCSVGTFFDARFVRSNEIACAAQFYNGSAIDGWIEGRN